MGGLKVLNEKCKELRLDRLGGIMGIEEAIEKCNSIVKVHNDFMKDVKKETISAEEIEALGIVLKELDKYRNKIHYKNCMSCGKEIRTKRTDRKYCNECAKIRQKEYFTNMSADKREKRREYMKLQMRKYRAMQKVKEMDN